MQEFNKWLKVRMGLDIHPTILLLLLTALIILFLWIIRIIITKIAHKRSKEDLKKFFKAKKIINYITFIVGLLIIAAIWLPNFDSIITFLGILSAGLVVALTEPILNIAGWIYILVSRPFKIGERVQIGELAGDVIDLRVFHFTINEIGNWVQADQSTGRMVNVPNRKIFSDNLANYTKGFRFIWNELPITVTFESNWERAKTVLQSIADKHTQHLIKTAEEKILEVTQKYMIFYSKLTPIVYTSVIDYGVTLTIRYLCRPQQRRGSESKIWEDVLKEFAKTHDITFAYPTQRFFQNRYEGKIRDVQYPSSPADDGDDIK